MVFLLLNKQADGVFHEVEKWYKNVRKINISFLFSNYWLFSQSVFTLNSIAAITNLLNWYREGNFPSGNSLIYSSISPSCISNFLTRTPFLALGNCSDQIHAKNSTHYIYPKIKINIPQILISPYDPYQISMLKIFALILSLPHC